MERYFAVDSSRCGWHAGRTISHVALIDRRTKISSMCHHMELKNAYPARMTSNSTFLSAAKAKWTESTDYS